MKIILLLTSLTIPLIALANPIPQFPFVIVTESIEKQVKPDVVNIHFEMVAFDKSSEEAMASLTKSSAKMLEILKAHNISQSQLKSSQVEKSTRRARKEGTYNLDILGYEVGQRFTLKLNNLEKYPALANALLRLEGAADINALFKTTKEEEHKDNLILELSTKARKKADKLAHAQSREVRKVYGITTEGNFGQAYATFSLEHNPPILAFAADPAPYGRDLILAIPEYIKVQQRITAIYELK
ncbi:SIMPL domain-containing protein [Microbulbifer sp. 2201CG32-9]|uniref:SIMPL domain-containing protein n=1 Tax=Microbulbifer sp. 2201CG32-9 TaxID=3232309 RepID=UPI00345BE622